MIRILNLRLAEQRACGASGRKEVVQQLLIFITL
jgi:hypothetical protein